MQKARPHPATGSVSRVTAAKRPTGKKTTREAVCTVIRAFECFDVRPRRFKYLERQLIRGKRHHLEVPAGAGGRR